jgi:hypothetical protein
MARVTSSPSAKPSKLFKAKGDAGILMMLRFYAAGTGKVSGLETGDRRLETG